ncbi:MAG: hypothetical protein KC442_06390 [Thermomicrobiales bacterium]|nr:hypothetical protein [Thermomicrobiales bacterium]MCB0257285.1 hypothetical protein [Anaerolineae bacterium]
MGTDDFVLVQATVRRSKVPAFYAMVSDLNAEADEVRKAVEKIKNDPVQGWSVWQGEEGAALRAAAVIYETISPKAREIVNLSLDHSRRLSKEELFGGTSAHLPIHGNELARELDLTLPQLAGTLTSLGVRSRAVNRRNPIGSQPHREHGGEYWLDPAAETFFWTAREEYENTQKELQRRGIWDDLRCYRDTQGHILDEIDTELDNLGNGELPSDAETRRTKLHASRSWHQGELVESAKYIEQMSCDVEYLPPQEWRTPFSRHAEETAKG